MESKLEAYRLKKRREVMKEKIEKSRTEDASLTKPLVHPISQECEDTGDLESIASDEDIELPSSKISIITKAIYVLYFLSWAILYLVALHYEFGAVYFIITSLIFIWKNTRSGPKKKGEISAYSVFNPNCEAIQGSINVEQLEREMGFGVPRVT